MKDKYRCLDFMGMNRWQVVVIPVGTYLEGRWVVTSKVTHSSGGKVCQQKSNKPKCGWAQYWQEYRKQHPELEPYWNGPP